MTAPMARLVCKSLAVAVLFWGCVNIERSYPDKRFFVFDIGRDAVSARPAGNGILHIGAVRVSPRYADRSFVYRLSDNRFEADFYNQFLISPSILIGEEVRHELSEAGIFQYVVGSANAPAAATHTLESTVNSLYGDFRDALSPKAALEMEFFLVQEAPVYGGIVFHMLYHQTVSVDGRTPDSLMQGWNQALDMILSSLVSDLKTVSLQSKADLSKRTGRTGPDSNYFTSRGARGKDRTGAAVTR